MKPNNPLIYLFLLVVSTGLTYAQQTVTLICNPDQIDESGPVEACYFLGGEGVNPEDYTTYASVDEVITWVGRSTSSDDTIDVFMIKYQGGVNVFNREELPGETSVQGKVERATPEDDPYKYEIRFKINSTGRLYKIDPIIKVRR